jgi:Ca2+-binding RTX toxin-like protein
MASIVGTSGNDTLTDTPENDSIDGQGGSDTIVIAHGGEDTIDGGSGYDTISFYGQAPGGVVFDFGNGRTSNVERLVADRGDDHLIGTVGSQNLSGVAGNDILEGRAGNDSLWSGAGNDQFVFREFGSANADTLGDFASGLDKIVLDGTVMSALGADGNFVAGDARFTANSSGTAQDSSDRIVYNTSTRQIFYDADGNGSGTAQLIATLHSGATLSATDIVVGNGAPSQQPTQGDDHLVGTSGDDIIEGAGGKDLIEGLGGNDTLIGGLDEDRLIGGEGNDVLDGRDEVFMSSSEEVVDILDGGPGDDTYLVRDGAVDTIVADPGGVDMVVALNTDWILGEGLENLDLVDTGSAFDGTGNGLDNVIRGASEGGTLLGLGGNDTLIVRVAQNTGEARGGDGDDILQGSQSRLFGDAGNDLFLVSGGRQSMTGGTGADVFFFEDASSDVFFSDEILDFASGTDVLRLDATEMPALGASGTMSAGDARFAANSSGVAQDASDRVVYSTTSGELWYDADGSGAGEADLIVTLDGAPPLAATDIEVVNGTAPGGEHIVGTSGNDTLTDTPGNDTIEGLSGNDTIVIAHGGEDIIDGGAGYDSISFYGHAPDGVEFDFGNGRTSNVERLLADGGDDHLIGTAGSQNLSGVSGDDILEGGAGSDLLWGGAGEDTFIFRETGAANADRIGDFSSADTIALDNAAMAALGADGDFSGTDGRFWAASGANSGHDANDRVVYNTSTGQLYYDADGSGGGGAELIATLSGTPALTASDITVI